MMHVRGLLVAVALLAIAGGAVWWSSKNKKDDAEASASTNPKILDLKAEDLKRIEIRRSPGETTVLERAGGGAWTMVQPQPFALDAGAVASFAESLATLEADKLVEAKVADFAPYGLKEPVYYVLLTTKDGKLRTVLLGDETPMGSGWFARLAGDQRLFTIGSVTKGDIDKRAADLRDKRLLTYDERKLTLIGLVAKHSYTELARNNRNEWQIVKPQAMRADGGQVEEVLRRLRDARLDPYVLPEDAKKNEAVFAASAPFALIVATDANGPQRFEVKKSGDGRYLAKSSVVDGVHVLTADLAEGLAKSAEELRNRKVFDFGFSEPSRVDYKDGQRARTFAKSGENWRESNKELDSVGVQSLIDRLRNLSALKFPAGLSAAPEIEISVTSGEGKHVEKVLIGKAGAVWIAWRDGEPPLYEIDAAAIESLKQSAQDVREAPQKAGEKK